MDKLEVRMPGHIKDSFKAYCDRHNTTMSRVILDYVFNLVEDVSERYIPRAKKISKPIVKDAVSKKSVFKQLELCPKCGNDITNMTGYEKWHHIKGCKGRSKVANLANV